MYKVEFIFLGEFFVLSIFVAILLYSVSYFGVIKDIYIEKNMSYECGFNPFEDARNTFDVRFYLVGILFIIFDLEVIFLFPWSIIFSIDILNFWIMLSFLIILLIGFAYEWKKRALDWS